MKAILILSAGLLVGLFVLYISQCDPCQELRKSAESYPSVYSEISSDPTTLYVAYDSALLIENVSTGEKYEVTFAPPDDGVVDYEWASLPDSRCDGEGSLCESFVFPKMALGNCASSIEDAEDSLFLYAGSLRIEWSHGSQEGGWLYYNPRFAALSVKTLP